MNPTDLFFIQKAIHEAKKAYQKDEVPVGAVIVYQNKIIARAHNQIETHKSADAHAELLAVRKAAQKRNDWRLIGCTLYSTLEPCPMCAGALLHARIDRVVYGAKDFKWGACETKLHLFEPNRFNHTAQCDYIPIPECSELLSQFFKQKRYCHKIP